MPWAAPAGEGPSRVPDPAGVLPGLKRLVAARRHLPHLHASTPAEVLEPRNAGVFHVLRRHPLGPMLALHNVTDRPQSVGLDLLHEVGLPSRPHDHVSGGPAAVRDGGVVLAPYAVAWLTDGTA